MKISINQKDLLKQISIAQKAVSKSTAQSVEGILLIAKEGKIRLFSTDYELSIITETECVVEQEGSIVINSNLFGNIVRKLPDDTVYITVNKLRIDIVCRQAVFNLMGLDPIDFPNMPEVDTPVKLTISAQELTKAIKYTVFSVSQDDGRPVLKGILLETDEGFVNFASLDGYRMSRVKIPVSDHGEISEIVPSRAMAELSRIIEQDDTVTVRSIKGHILFEFGNTKLFSKLINGKFLDYKNILAARYVTHTVVDRMELESALERSSILAKDDKAKLVKILIGEDSIQLKSNNEIGNVYEKISCKTEGSEVMIAFNTKYITEGIKIIESDDVRINLNGPEDPCTVVPIGDDIDYIYLALPVKVKNEEF